MQVTDAAEGRRDILCQGGGSEGHATPGILVCHIEESRKGGKKKYVTEGGKSAKVKRV